MFGAEMKNLLSGTRISWTPRAGSRTTDPSNAWCDKMLLCQSQEKKDLETWKRIWLSAIQSFSKPLPRSLHLKEDQTICSWPTYFLEAHMIRHIFFDTLNPMGFNCESLPSCWTSSRRGWACCRSERWRPGKRNHVFTFGSSSSSPGRVRLLVGRGCVRAH